jgi:hypothetical protein
MPHAVSQAPQMLANTMQADYGCTEAYVLAQSMLQNLIIRRRPAQFHL